MRTKSAQGRLTLIYGRKEKIAFIGKKRENVEVPITEETDPLNLRLKKKNMHHASQEGYRSPLKNEGQGEDGRSSWT